MRVAGAALISSAAVRLAPEGGAKRAVRLACGLASALALLSIAVSPDYGSLSRYVAEYRMKAEAIIGEAGASMGTETRFIIESRTDEYILDKADAEGLTVSVTASWSEDGFWYPTAARLGGVKDETERKRIGALVEAELGIPEDSIRWTE